MVHGDGAVHYMLQAPGRLRVRIHACEIVNEFIVLPPVLRLLAAEDPDRIDGVEIDGVPVHHPVGEVPAVALAVLVEDDPAGHRLLLRAGFPHRLLHMVLLRGGGKDRSGEQDGYEDDALHFRAQRYILAKNSPNMPGIFAAGFPDPRKTGIASVENARKYFST